VDYDRAVLYGREEERGRLNRLLDAACAGTSGAVVVRGEPGVGKTSLLDAAAATERMRVLRAVGVESESELAFAGLHQLLRPILGDLETLAPPRRAALSAALGLSESAGPVDRFLVAAAALDLLTAEAERTPILAIVDDAQWLDGASQDTLLFVTRRLGEDAVAMVFGAREGDQRRFDARGVDDMYLEGLDQDSAIALIGRETGVAPSAAVVSRLVAETRGNPLALSEIARATPVAALRGTEPLPELLPLSGGVEAVYVDRISRLPEATRAMLLLAALEPAADPAVLTRAGAMLGAGIADLDAAETAGIVHLGARGVAFDHPLLRSAVEGTTTWAQRRAAHQALAESLPQIDADRRAWHRASAAVEPDEGIASELERLAERTRLRAGNAAAQAALARAAELTPEPMDAGRRLVAAAEAAWHGGRATEALALLDRASGVASVEESLRAQHLRGVIGLRTGALSDAHRVLMTAAAEAVAVDADLAVRLVGDAAMAGMVGGNLAWTASAAETMRGLPEPPSHGPRVIRSVVAAMGALLGGDIAEGTLQLRSALELAELEHEADTSYFAVIAASLIGNDAATMRLLTTSETAAREAGRIGELPQLLIVRAAADNIAGRFASAMAAADEGARLSSEAGQRAPFAGCRAHFACAAAVRGEMELAQDAAAEATAVASELGIGIAHPVAAYATALVEIGAGRDEAALAILGSIDHPILQPYRAADECEALVRLGRPEAAAEPAARLEAIATATRLPVNAARLERCRGLLADSDAEEHFELALQLHGDAQPFERARTELAYGETLRRGRRRLDARPPLRRALEAFERMGAKPWASRAERELRATGETTRRRDPSTVDQLTPQELTICRLVAEGRTNREVAAQLFLSARTIEYHLRKAFAKLGITSRVELARLDLGASPVPEPVPAG
jgi:DNA-binding CsgD family transcriptional regulator